MAPSRPCCSRDAGAHHLGWRINAAGAIPASGCSAGGVNYAYNNCTTKGHLFVGFLSFRYIIP